MTKLSILGPGLLGGSIALAARWAGGIKTSIWARREAALNEVRSRGLADFASTDLHNVVRDADLTILCVPIGAMPDLARKLRSIIPLHGIVTDVGSVKAPVVSLLGSEEILGAQFVGSHPMAGSEQAGIAFARADLFDGAVCIITPEEKTPPSAVFTVEELWVKLGARVRFLSADDHDEAIAAVSHFPHLLAATLIQAVQGRDPRALELVGPGFRDITRVASGSPEMWAEILVANRGPVRKSAEAMIEKLRQALTLLERPDDMEATRMHDFLSQAKIHRDQLHKAPV